MVYYSVVDADREKAKKRLDIIREKISDIIENK